MAADRLQAFGTANRAVFAILDATMARQGDVLRGSFAVSLTMYGDDGSQRGFAEARVESRHSGRIDDLRSVLYDMTKSMMNDMNVEFEYQIHRNLTNWMTAPVAPDTPVQQAPLDGSAPAQSPAPAPADGSGGAPPPQAGPDETPAPAPGPVETPAYPPSYLQVPPDQPQ